MVYHGYYMHILNVVLYSRIQLGKIGEHSNKYFFPAVNEICQGEVVEVRS